MLIDDVLIIIINDNKEYLTNVICGRSVFFILIR